MIQSMLFRIVSGAPSLEMFKTRISVRVLTLRLFMLIYLAAGNSLVEIPMRFQLLIVLIAMISAMN